MARIGIDARPLANPRDGIGRFTYEIVQRLIKSQAFEWYLYSHKPSRHPMQPAIIRTPPNYWHSGVLVSQLLFPKWAKEDDLDLFWSPRHHLPIHIKCPTIVTIHDICWKVAPETMPVQRKIAERILFPASVNHADFITTISDTTRRDLIELYPSTAQKSIVVGPGHPDTMGITPSHQKTPYILNVGTIEPRKQQHVLIDAYLKIAELIPHDLVFVGDQGWKSANLAKRLAEKGFGHRIKWHRSVADDELATLYANADLYVTTSKYEGFNIPILEAMTWGIPVIASDISVHREVAQDGAIYATPSAENIASTIMQVLCAEDLKARLIAAGQRRHYDFVWQTSTDKLLGLFKEFCDRG